jgi:hypothetical protein
MMTASNALRVVQVALIAASFIAWGNWSIAFFQFMREGSAKADVTHPVELDQHGSIAYISVHQSHVLTEWQVIAASAFITAALLDLYRRKRYPNSEG